jgi:hypothetical protein
MAVTDEARVILAAKFEVILPHLDERQRRLLLGAEARALGHGGIRAVAQAAGVREATVAAGVDELDAGAAPLGRVRRPGGGRKPLTRQDPGLLPALLALIEPDERGDPMSPLRWTTKSLRTLAGELTRQGHRVSADTVGELLHGQGFSLQANVKTLEGRHHPDRDGQFQYVNEQVKGHQDSADPVISVDTKKKEQLGQYANPGRQWRPRGEPIAVRDHAFPDPDTSTAVPYGVYDLTGNTGWVNVGTDHDTAAFAVESIRRWWRHTGRNDYPHARRLLITADAGGSNSYRSRTWKTQLAALAEQIGLAITVCHFPPGTSKWNKIEHRLFSHITHNWAGRPLTSHEVVVQSIAATTTRTGLRVHAELDTGTYPLGQHPSRQHFDAIPLHPHDWHPDWNYTLAPQPAPATTSPKNPAATPRPDLRWLQHPAITGLPADDFTNLVTILDALRPPQRRGFPPALTTADRLAATTLHHHHRLPQRAIAALFAVTPETLNHNIQQTRRLLHQAQRTIPTNGQRLRTTTDLHTYAATHHITTKTPS